MALAKIEPNYRITIPEDLRATLKVGDEVIITADAAGRLTLIPKTRVLEILERTAGMWQGRNDIPPDGIEYVNEMRQGRRLRDC